MHTPALYSSKYHATQPRSENVQFSAVLLIRRTYPPTSPEEKRALENPDRPIFYALDAARALIATWRQRYNGVSAVLLLGDPARHRTLTVIRACQAAVIADDGHNWFVRKCRWALGRR